VTPTGSVHIVGLPDPVAVRALAFDEPNQRWAGGPPDVGQLGSGSVMSCCQRLIDDVFASMIA